MLTAVCQILPLGLRLELQCLEGFFLFGQGLRFKLVSFRLHLMAKAPYSVILEVLLLACDEFIHKLKILDW